MTGYLGFDPDLLAALRGAMRAAISELATVRSSDGEARLAMQMVARARWLLTDTWQPFVDSLFECRALDGYRPVEIGDGDLINSWLRSVAEARQWRVATDPLAADAEVMTIEQARVLGESLSGAAGAEPMTAEEITWLGGALVQIAARPDLIAAFLPAFTTVGWTNVCNQLGSQRQRRITQAVMYDGTISAGEHAGWMPIDAVFASLGTVLVRNREVHPLSDAEQLLTDMTPYAAALLVQRLELDADALSRIARQLVERERSDPYDARETNLGPRAADLLFATMLTTSGAATAYVLLTLDKPELVLDSAYEPELGNALVVAGTHPASMSAVQAASALPALARWMLGAADINLYLEYNPRLAVAAAELIAPYLLPLFRSADDGYGMTARERRGIELLVLDDHEAFDHLLAARDRIVSGLSSLIDTANPGHIGNPGDMGNPGDTRSSVTNRIATLRDVADLLAIVDTMARASSIRGAEREQAEWDVLWTTLGWASGAVSTIGGAWAEAPGPALTVLRRTAEAAGWGPTSVATVRTSSLDRYDTVTTVAAATLVCATFDRMVAEHRLPADARLPPVPDVGAEDTGATYTLAFDTWLAASDFDPAVVYELDSIKQTIASAHEATADANGKLLDL